MCEPAAISLASPTLWSAIGTAVALTVALIAIFTSLAQRREHRERIRLDLFDRRYEVFNSVLGFYNAILLWNDTPEQAAARDRFFYAYQQSGFLFKKDSGIQELLKELHEEGHKVIGNKQSSADISKQDPALGTSLFLKTQDIQINRFPAALDKLKLALAEYLNFHNVDR
jgi:hypothetical protein